MRPVPEQLYPFAGHRLELDGLSMHYVDEGAGPPVLMVHGNATWSISYRQLVLGLRDRYRCIAPDLIGMGRSDVPGDDRYEYTLERRADDLDRLVTALDLNDITLVGHDWGGMVAMAWAIRRPERIRRFVMMNTVAFINPPDLPLPLVMTIMRGPLGPLLARGLNLIAHGLTIRGSSKGLGRELRRAYLAPYDSWHNRIAIHRFVQDVPLKPDDRAWALIQRTESLLPSFRDRPALLLWGLRDFLVKEGYLDHWRRHWPHAEVVRVPEAGHFLLEDEPDAGVGAIRDFLDRT